MKWKSFFKIEDLDEHYADTRREKIKNNHIKKWAESLRHCSREVKSSMKRCSISYVIRVMKIKIIVTLELPKSRTLTMPNPGKEVEQQELPFIASGNAKRSSHFRRQFGGFLQN